MRRYFVYLSYPNIKVTTNISINGFALVVSMSSLCGDDYTFHQIYNMIIGSTIDALGPIRHSDFEEATEQLISKQEAKYVSHIATDPTWERMF